METKQTSPQRQRCFINKSRSGHYTVTVWEGNKRVFRSIKISGINMARDALAKYKQSAEQATNKGE